jgi:predicted O-linked N-acetylglucosamine transferase (SPINDLY family)
MAGSLLRAVGLPELVTTSAKEYENLASQLARDPARLAAVKARLVRNRDTYPLFDTARFTRHLETAFTTIYDRLQQGLPPTTFTVEPRV